MPPYVNWMIAAARAALHSSEEGAARYPVPYLSGVRPELTMPRYPVDLEFARGQIADAVVSAYDVPRFIELQDQCYVALSQYRVPLIRRDGRGNPALQLFPAHRHPVWPNYEGTGPLDGTN